MFELTSYVGLFVAAFAAATLLPMQSEAVLVGMLHSAQYVASTLLAVATLQRSWLRTDLGAGPFR